MLPAADERQQQAEEELLAAAGQELPTAAERQQRANVTAGNKKERAAGRGATSQCRAAAGQERSCRLEDKRQ
jgi:hypothetical protein